MFVLPFYNKRMYVSIIVWYRSVCGCRCRRKNASILSVRRHRQHCFSHGVNWTRFCHYL